MHETRRSKMRWTDRRGEKRRGKGDERGERERETIREEE